MKHHPLFDLACFAIGYIISALLMYLFKLILDKLGLGVKSILSKLENTIGESLCGILVMLSFVPLPVVFTIALLWLEVAVDYYTDGDVAGAITCLLYNIISCFYISFATKDLPPSGRRRW